jgi:hypothetical protein
MRKAPLGRQTRCFNSAFVGCLNCTKPLARNKALGPGHGSSAGQLDAKRATRGSAGQRGPEVPMWEIILG